MMHPDLTNFSQKSKWKKRQFRLFCRECPNVHCWRTGSNIVKHAISTFAELHETDTTV